MEQVGTILGASAGRKLWRSVGAVLGGFIATLGAIAIWQLGPAWYSLANIAVALPCASLGGWLRERP